MISLLLLQLFISYTCLLSGIVVYHFLPRNRSHALAERSLPAYLITGLVALTTLSQIIVLFLPVSIFQSLILFAGLQVFIALKQTAFQPVISGMVRSIKGLYPLSGVAFVIMWFWLLLLNAGPTLMDDTESYHIQMVKWIHQWGTVPGLANLHERFGFNSSWFSSIALFTFSTDYNFYTVLNGTLSVWFLFYLWTNIDAFFKNKKGTAVPFGAVAALSVLLVSLLCWPMIRGNVSMANYDAIATLCLFILFFELVVNKADLYRLQTEAFLWPVYLFTVRIINYPLLIFTITVCYHFLGGKQRKALLVYSGFSFLLVAPFLIRNIVLSGYPFYPGPYGNFFAVDWKTAPDVVTDLLYFIKYFNRVNTAYQPIEQTAALTGLHWIPVWFRYLFSYDKVVVVAGLCGLAVPLLKRNLLKNKMVLLVYVLLTVQLLSWFFIAPDPRFIYGCFLCGIVLLLLPFAPFLKGVGLNRLFRALAVSSVLLLSFIGVKKLLFDESYQNAVLPYKLPQPPVRNLAIDGVVFHIPEAVLNNWNPRCYASALPCVYKINPHLHLRGKKIKDGFSVKY